MHISYDRPYLLFTVLILNAKYLKDWENFLVALKDPADHVWIQYYITDSFMAENNWFPRALTFRVFSHLINESFDYCKSTYRPHKYIDWPMKLSLCTWSPCNNLLHISECYISGYLFSFLISSWNHCLFWNN